MQHSRKVPTLIILAALLLKEFFQEKKHIEIVK